jgi:hypothetical protein
MTRFKTKDFNTEDAEKIWRRQTPFLRAEFFSVPLCVLCVKSFFFPHAL